MTTYPNTVPTPEQIDLADAIVMAVAIVCQEEGWVLLNVNLLNPIAPEFEIKIGNWRGKLGCHVEQFELEVTAEDATMIALSFKDAVHSVLIESSLK